MSDADKLHRDPVVRMAYWLKRAERAEAELAALRAGVEKLADEWATQDRNPAALREVRELLKRGGE